MKNDNKGFSLIELIVVIAIMAILVGVLAPNVIRYVSQSRVSADTQLADTVRSAVQIALADPDISDAPTAATTLDFTDATSFTAGFGAAIATNLGYSSLANMVGTSGVASEAKSMTPTGFTATIDGNLRVTVTITDGTNTITVP